jgi:hypothetical protein
MTTILQVAEVPDVSGDELQQQHLPPCLFAVDPNSRGALTKAQKGGYEQFGFDYQVEGAKQTALALRTLNTNTNTNSSNGSRHQHHQLKASLWHGDPHTASDPIDGTWAGTGHFVCEVRVG